MRLTLTCLFLAALCFLCGCTPQRPPLAALPLSEPAENPPRNWHLLDPSIDHFPGISAERAYRELLKNKRPMRMIVVAVIDQGIDTTHAAISPVLWTNAGEIPRNNVDDDHNGHVDDVHGWNFAGGKDGRNLDYSTVEVTRLYRQCVDTVAASRESMPSRCPEIVKSYFTDKKEIERQSAELTAALDTLNMITRILARALEPDSLVEATVVSLKSSDPAVLTAQKTWIRYVHVGWTQEVLTRVTRERQTGARIWFDPQFDANAIVQDHPNDLWESDYGNNDVTGPQSFHGTHVAGIIGALPDSGVIGIARGVRVMSVRSICDCDERDKDVANAIRYAVDNGANVVSMSFNKSYSPQKVAVDSAVKYADSKGVLIVHGAGNGAADLATTENYPTARYLDGGEARNWIEVGASSWRGADSLVAPFSNYGPTRVDVFAPGVAVYSTATGGHYARLDGTSMSTPMVSGIAAVLMQYYPQLSAADVKRIILASATRYRNQLVIKPGGNGELVPFGHLSATGGIANLYAALRLAEQERRSH